jgi:hypothetical protein
MAEEVGVACAVRCGAGIGRDCGSTYGWPPYASVCFPVTDAKGEVVSDPVMTDQDICVMIYNSYV